MEGFIEILEGLFYCEADGSPWSNRVRGGKGKIQNELIKLKLNNKLQRFCVRRNKKLLFWHRLVWEHFNGPIPDGLVIDHFDNNSTNNLISNLRVSTKKDNARKRLKQINNSSGFAGVYKTDALKNPYWSYIMVNKKRIYLGVFKTPEEAHKAFITAKIKYHGEESIKPLL
jgi:hypothetical protein